MDRETAPYYQPWQDPDHALNFDCWAHQSKGGLKRIYEKFNEIQLLKQYADKIQGVEFVEIGCATGELYRYINSNFPKFHYYGFDISKVAIARAQEKYPKGRFVISQGFDSIEAELHKKPALVFSRDVLIHQTDPYDFLDKILQVPSEFLILRIRTRDRGESVLDPEQSCQYHYNKWIPYMILNTEEFIDTVKRKINFSTMHLMKSYMQLGGYHSRFLPKDCYYPETGTAETAVLIQISTSAQAEKKVIIEAKDDGSKLSRDLSDYYYTVLSNINKRCGNLFKKS